MANQTLVFKKFKNFCYLLLIFFAGLSDAALQWQELRPGLSYVDLSLQKTSPWSHLHAFKVNLQKNTIQLIMAKDLKQKAASVEEFNQQYPAFITINGGFFDKAYQPLGLRLRNKIQENPFKPISWWAVFFIQDNQPQIVAGSDFYPNAHISLAIQSGPRLLIDGEIPLLKPGIAERTALCITKSKEVVLLVTENFGITTKDLAARLKKSPLNCVQAINLDGGSSSQIYAQIGDFKVHVPGFSQVSDGLSIELSKARR